VLSFHGSEIAPDDLKESKAVGHQSHLCMNLATNAKQAENDKCVGIVGLLERNIIVIRIAWVAKVCAHDLQTDNAVGRPICLGNLVLDIAEGITKDYVPQFCRQSKQWRVDGIGDAAITHR